MAPPRILRVTVPASWDGRSCERFLRGEYGFSYTLSTKLKHIPGSVTRNGDPIRMRDEVHTGDVIETAIPVLSGGPGRIVPGAPEPDVLFEDEDIIIINKPAGMSVHGSVDRGDHTVKEMICSYLGNAEFHPVNRLDCGTSGVMTIAKNMWMTDLLRKKLHTGDFLREYLAVTEGGPPCDEGEVTVPLEPVPGTHRMRTADRDGLESVTAYRVLYRGEKRSLLSVIPRTGRTHQIRIHMAYLGCPLAGDGVYGDRGIVTEGKLRPALHSLSVTLIHPLTGNTVNVSAPEPDDFRAFLPGYYEKGD